MNRFHSVYTHPKVNIQSLESMGIMPKLPDFMGMKLYITDSLPLDTIALVGYGKGNIAFMKLSSADSYKENDYA